MQAIRDTFRQAMLDYALLLNRQYPQSAILKLVGDRYKLSRTERNILYRGISTRETSSPRIRKLTSAESLAKKPLHIDTLNQLYTIAAYLNGNPVFISTDGFLRDAAAVHGTGWLNKHLVRAIRLMNDFLITVDAAEVKYFIDEKVNHSREVARQIEKLKSRRSPSTILVHPRVDQELRDAKQGILATSDSQVVDKTTLAVLDLARHVLHENFTPDFFDLGFLYHK